MDRAAGGRTSRFRGVCFNRKNKKWQASINVFGKYVYLGLFHSEEEAAQAYDKASLKARGLDCTKINFPASTYLDSNGQLPPDEHLDALIDTTKLQTAHKLLSEANTAALDAVAAEALYQQQQQNVLLQQQQQQQQQNVLQQQQQLVQQQAANTLDGDSSGRTPLKELRVKMALLKQRIGRRRTAGLDRQLLTALIASQCGVSADGPEGVAHAAAPASTVPATAAAAAGFYGQTSDTDDQSGSECPADVGEGGTVTGFTMAYQDLLWPEMPLSSGVQAAMMPSTQQQLQQQLLLQPNVAVPDLSGPSLHELLQCEAQAGVDCSDEVQQWCAAGSGQTAGELLQQDEWLNLAAPFPLHGAPAVASTAVASPAMPAIVMPATALPAATAPLVAAPVAAPVAPPMCNQLPLVHSISDRSISDCSGSCYRDNKGSPEGFWPCTTLTSSAGGVSCVSIGWLLAQLPPQCQLQHVITHPDGVCGILYSMQVTGAAASPAVAGSGVMWGAAVWDGHSDFSHAELMNSPDEASRVCNQVLNMTAAARRRQRQQAAGAGSIKLS